MSDVVPSLDTIDFDQLVENARGDIPRYAPDWTDHNLHDPGMSFIDLLAWVVDQQVFRTGYVGGRFERAFAALLGQRPDGPEPARGLVWPDGRVEAARSVAAGAEVICRQHPDLHFALEWPDTTVSDRDDTGESRSIYLPSAMLRRVRLDICGVQKATWLSDSGSGSWVVGDGGRTAGAVLTLELDRPLGMADRSANVLLGIDVAPAQGPPSSAGEPRAWGPVAYSYRAGRGDWGDVHVLHDGTLGLAGTGVVLLAIPPQAAEERSGSELRLDLDRGFFPVPPELTALAINVLPVVQRTLVGEAPFDIVGTGRPDQVIELDTGDLVRAPSRPHGPLLEIKVGGELWSEQPGFACSGPDDRHFVVEADEVRFGNGVNGDRPKLGAQITHSELARSSGAAGNLRRGLTWSLLALGASGADFGRNRGALAGGRDRTERADLARASQEAASKRSAVLTDDDLVAAAYGLPGMAVGRAEVIPGFDHRLPDRRIDGVRTVVVLPDQPSGHAAGPSDVLRPTQEYLDEIADRVDPRRVLGERLVIRGPVIVQVDIALSISAEPGTMPDEVSADVERAIRRHLSPVRSAGVDPRPLGRDLTACELESVAANVAGVATVTRVQVVVAGEVTDDGVVVPPDGLVAVRDIRIDIGVGRAFTAHEPVPTTGERGMAR
jgi:hypothetical protein